MRRFLTSVLNTLPNGAKAVRTLVILLHKAGGGSAKKMKILRLLFLLCAHLALLLPRWGDKVKRRDNPGCRSLRSLALGWGLLPLQGAA